MHPTIGELIIYAIMIIAYIVAIFIDPGRFEAPKKRNNKEPDD